MKGADQRRNVEVARKVDAALELVPVEGVGPAFEFMQILGVERSVALRVLTAPRFHRKVDRRQGSALQAEHTETGGRPPLER
ncbi:hypothetical protein [Pseudoduganella namucuonensis]|nr:hypothetical protein [Pseudoduganella namucuonensis]